MAERFGGTVYGCDGKRYDWGQALARERYGENWNAVVPDEPDTEALRIALEWKDGKWPEWAQEPSHD